MRYNYTDFEFTNNPYTDYPQSAISDTNWLKYHSTAGDFSNSNTIKRQVLPAGNVKSIIQSNNIPSTYITDFNTVTLRNINIKKTNFYIFGSRAYYDPQILSRYYVLKECHMFSDNEYWINRTTRLKSKGNYIMAVRSDYDIPIGFIGQKDRAITVKSNSPITFTDNIRNNSLDAKFTVETPKNGSITQLDGTKIFGNKLDLQTQGNISGINVTSLDESKPVNIIAKTGGNIDINVTGDIFIDNIMKISKDRLSKNTVDLTATGNIKMEEAPRRHFEGDKINLTSKNGKIEVNGIEPGYNPIADDPTSASLNASAYGDIYIKSVSDNLRIGQIKSTTGNVTIHAYGRLIDVTGDQSTSIANEQISEKIDRWVNTGLIAGPDRNNEYI